MKRRLLVLVVLSCMAMSLYGQSSSLWTEADRDYLLYNLARTRDSIIKETAGLTTAQWNFKESPERWSIAQVIEHLSYWEIIYSREVALSLRQKPQPELNESARADSSYLNFLTEESPHVAPSYATPLGLNEGKNNMALLVKLRNESISFLKTTSLNLRAYFLSPSRPNVHQVFLNVYGHCDRHLRQIRKIKRNPAYPG